MGMSKGEKLSYKAAVQQLKAFKTSVHASLCDNLLERLLEKQNNYN